MMVAIAWSGVGLGLLFFVGLVFLAVGIPLGFAALPQGFKDRVWDYATWLFWAAIILFFALRYS